MKPSRDSILQTAIHNFQLAANRLNLDEPISQKLLASREKIEITLNPALPGGKVINIKVFVVRRKGWGKDDL